MTPRLSAGTSLARSRPRCGSRGSTRRGSPNERSRGWRSARAGAAANWSSASANRTTRSEPTPPTSPRCPRPAPRSSSAPCSRSTPAAATTAPRSSPRWSTSRRWVASSSSPRRSAPTTRSATTPSGWSRAASTRQARSYATFEVGMKAGGLAVLGIKASGHLTTIKLLITYANDSNATRIPSQFQIATLVHDRS